MLLFDSVSPLRQSCDRCHRRKQRCTRSGAQDDKPCRRCKEAGEKCVYSPPLRSGRPKTRKPKEGKPRENEARRNPLSSDLPTSCSVEIPGCVQSATTTDPTFITNNMISAFALTTGDSDTSRSDCTTATASSTLPTVSDESVEFWWSPGDCDSNLNNNIITPDSIYGTPTNAMDGPWSELLGREWQSDTASAFDLDEPYICAEIPNTDPGREKDIYRPRNSIDPIPLLSRINLQLHEIETPDTPQSSDWKGTLDRVVQTTQSFIQALNKLLPERLATSNIILTQDKWQVSRPAFLHVANPSKENFSASGPEASRSPTQKNSPGPPVEKIDSIVLRLALICYIQVIRSYKGVVAMLADTLVWAEMYPGENMNLMPIRIGTLQAVVSPQLHISMLVQLVTHHSDELCDKVRQLAARTIDGHSQAGPNYSGTLLNGLIGIDVFSEEKDLRDELELITAKLRNLHTIPIS